MTSLRHKTALNAFFVCLFGSINLKNQLKDNCFTMWCQFLMYRSMRCKYTCVPSLLNFSHNPYPIPLLQVVAEYQIEPHVIYSKFPLAVCFTYGSIYISMPLFQFVPPSTSLTVSISTFSTSSSLFLLNVSRFSRVRLFATPWTVVRQALLFMEFSRQEYWSGLPFSSPGNLPNPGIEPGFRALWQMLYWLSHQGSKIFAKSSHF